MLAAFLLVLREVLEAALVISIVMAATRGVLGREKFVLAGVGAGILGAVLLAMITDQIANQFDGMGQEVFNACVLFAATGMLTWHVVWMSSHGRQLAEQIKAVGHAVAIGVKPMSALAFVIAAAVLREGAEIVLFMQGLMTGEESMQGLWLGSAGGLLAGAALGAAIYTGMLRIPLRHLFQTTNGFLIAVAAGMSAKAAHYLAVAGFLPEMGSKIWDTSHVLPDDSVLGSTLSAFMGYTATPSGIQLLFFAATVAGIVGLSRWVADRTISAQPARNYSHL